MSILTYSGAVPSAVSGTFQTDGESYIAVDTSTIVTTVTLSSKDIADKSRRFVIGDISGNAATNNITVNTEGAQTINGQSSIVIDQNNGSVELYNYEGDLYLLESGGVSLNTQAGWDEVLTASTQTQQEVSVIDTPITISFSTSLVTESDLTLDSSGNFTITNGGLYEFFPFLATSKKINGTTALRYYIELKINGTTENIWRYELAQQIDSSEAFPHIAPFKIVLQNSDIVTFTLVQTTGDPTTIPIILRPQDDTPTVTASPSASIRVWKQSPVNALPPEFVQDYTSTTLVQVPSIDNTYQQVNFGADKGTSSDAVSLTSNRWTFHQSGIYNVRVQGVIARDQSTGTENLILKPVTSDGVIFTNLTTPFISTLENNTDREMYTFTITKYFSINDTLEFQYLIDNVTGDADIGLYQVDPAITGAGTIPSAYCRIEKLQLQ